MVSETFEALAETLRQLEAALARIPQSRRPEMAGRARAELLLSHLAKSGVAVLIANEHGRYVHANAAAARLTGYTTDELTGLSVWDLTPSANQTDGRRLWDSFVETGRQEGEYALRHKDGHIVSARFVALAHVLPGVHVSLLVARAAPQSVEGAVA